MFGAAGHGDDAVGAELVAADHDADVGLVGAGSHFGVAEGVVALEAIGDFESVAVFASQGDGDGVSSGLTGFVDHAGDFGELACADDDVDVRGALEDLLLVFLGHAAEHADDLVGAVFADLSHAAELGVDLLFGVFTDAAGVEEDGVGFFGVFGEFVALLTEGGDDEFAVQDVHLAADGFDEDFFVVIRHGEKRFTTEDTGVHGGTQGRHARAVEGAR